MNTPLFVAVSLVSASLATPARAQEIKLWAEHDRTYLIENLIRSRDALLRETNDLTEKQWRFKESPDRWSLNEIVEHIAIYELMFQRQITQTLATGPRPELNSSAKPDNTYLDYVMAPEARLTTDFTHPFTYADPMGLNDGKNNVAWFLKMRNESIQFLQTTTYDLRAYYLTPDRPNIHQLYIWTFGHVDRAMRQIRKLKENAAYPSK